MKFVHGFVITVLCVVPGFCMTVVVPELISVEDKNSTRTNSPLESTTGLQGSAVPVMQVSCNQSANTSTPNTNYTGPENGSNSTAGNPSTTSQVSVTECGKSHPRSRRVVGGKAVTSNRYPWNVALFVEGGEYPYCGGAALSGIYIMTAAHCVRGKTAEMLSVGFGSLVMDYERLLDSKEKHVVNVAEIKRHPLFKDIIHGDDIAMLRLSEPLRTSGEVISPICLPQGIDMRNLVGQVGVVAGWGRIAYGGEHTFFLRSVDLPLVSHDECCRVFKDVITVREEIFCAGVLNGTKDACQGDSGGPLMWQNPATERWMVIGIVSFGVKCAEPGYYGTYTKVTSYISWICEATSGELCNS